METIIKSLKDCSGAELDTFERLVLQGGEVAAGGLRQRIKRAEKLVFINDRECVAVGAIKNPNADYKERVFKKAGAPDPEKYVFELGWLYVDQSARGKGYGRVLMASVVGALINKACFATTRENNDSMHYLFEQFDFSKLGQPYESDYGDYSLVLYTKS